MLTTSWMNPKQIRSNAAGGPKITDKDIELLLKKGILGILDDQEGQAGEAHTMDIDELIRNSKTTNYSMINDKYTITRINVDTDNKEQKVNIDDPRFWEKVLKDEKTPGKLLEEEFLKMKENNDFMDEEAQHEYFVRLNEQIYSYVEKAKNGEVNYEEEVTFFKILQSIMDDPFVREDLRAVSGLLISDIKKKPRRLKKRDISSRRRVSKKSKKPRVEDLETHSSKKSRRRGRDEEEFVLEESGARDSKRQKSRALGKRAKLEDEGLYRHSESEEPAPLSKRKKRRSKPKKKARKSSFESRTALSSKNGNDRKMKRVKRGDRSAAMTAIICIFCRQAEPLARNASPDSLEIETEKPENEVVVKCGPCSRTFHPSCLEDYLRSITGSSDIGLSLSLKNCLEDPAQEMFDAHLNTCLSCQVGLFECFICKNVGKVKEKVDARVQKSVREAILNSSHSLQRNETSLFEELGKSGEEKRANKRLRRGIQVQVLRTAPAHRVLPAEVGLPAGVQVADQPEAALDLSLAPVHALQEVLQLDQPVSRVHGWLPPQMPPGLRPQVQQNLFSVPQAPVQRGPDFAA